jgi:hypothetical protein
MSMPSPNRPDGPRMSRTVKLVVMGVAGAALLYSCAPGVGAGLGALPYLWFLPNPFYRAPLATPCPPGTPNCDQQASTSSGGGRGSSTSRGGSGSTTNDTSKATPSQSQRGGFGSTGGGASGAS